MKWHKLPYSLNEIKIEVTHDCTLKCSHCSSVAGTDSGRSMDWGSCKRIINEAAEMGVKEVAFSGGEPLLWANIQKATSLASKHGMRVFLYTTGNAANAEKLIDRLQSSGLSRVMFSILGADAQQHEQMTNGKGSYKKTLEVAKHCVSIGLDTEFHFVPLAHNFTALPVIAERARAMGVKQVSMLRLVPQGRGASGKNGQLSHPQNLRLIEMIDNLRAKGHTIRLGSPYNFLMLRDNPECCSGIDRLIIGPDLRIFPCDAFKHISSKEIGAKSEYSNLNAHSLSECWEKSTFLNAAREYLETDFATECKSCGNLQKCLSGCMAQKFYAFGSLKKCADPMCLLNTSTTEFNRGGNDDTQ